ncbi:peptidoglycan bridge formation glycyltransferase FemA/FemB family protein [Candidatus Microgenomates bacterium]|nr:peptidoglycan bridge formation glycyltransferase FemA/FemB family protein [Candidatus Microgenomates bacterium]
MARQNQLRGLGKITHPLQSREWGEFREKTGIKVVSGKDLPAQAGFQLTIHKIPHTPWSIGYLPKGPLPTKGMIVELNKIGKENNCIYIQLEPNVEASEKFKVQSSKLGLHPSMRPLFTKYNFVIDLTKSEEELLAAMHPKTRYNIRVAQKHGVTVEERTDDEAFKIYLKLYFETTKRQKYFGHTPEYHRLLWQTLNENLKLKIENSERVIPHLLIAYYKGAPLTTWLLLQFKDTLYYPYGGSSEQHKNVMASNLVMWEAMKLGKKLRCKQFDLWGALGPNPDQNDPWYGFHRFKQGYGGRLVEYVGSYDLVLNPIFYWIFHLVDKVRWIFLRLKSTI